MELSENDNLWAKLFSSERPTITVDFPVHENQTDKLQLKIIELTAEEASVCEMDAEAKIKKLFKGDFDKDGESYKSLYNKYNAANIIYRSCRNVNDISKKIFPTADAVISYLSVDQMGVIMNNYYDLIATKGCVKAMTDPEEMEIVINRIIADGTSGRFLLNSCSLEMLKELVMHLINQSSNSLTDNSSAGSPQNDIIESLINIEEKTL